MVGHRSCKGILTPCLIDKRDRSSKHSKHDGSKKRDREDRSMNSHQKFENQEPKQVEQQPEEPQNKKRKTAQVVEETGKHSEEDVPEHLKLSKFRISQGTVENLEARGIKSLFDIQAATFDSIFDGNDVLARARTGTGKTLAFALPVIEKLALDTEYNTRRGRAPRVLVMCPTRDLAKQVCGDFETISGNRLQALAVYGGTPYQEQTSVLKAGVDVIVGTPGRILDHIKYGNLKLHALKYIILDEADEM